MSYFGKLAPCITVAIGSLLMSAVGHAASIAFDSAATYTPGGSYNGQNGGTGFGAWNVVGTGTYSGCYLTASDSAGSPAFQIYVASNGDLNGYRPLTGGALASGQSILVTGLVLNQIADGAEAGFALTDSSNTKLIKVYAKWNDANGYYVDDATGTNRVLGVGYNLHTKLNFAFALGDTGAYTLTTTGVSSGTFVGTVGTTTGGITKFDHWAKGTSNNGEVYLESLAVTVPEPTSIALLGLASISLLARRRRA